jgi:hypothetical protein
VASINGKEMCQSKAEYGGISTNSGTQGTISRMGYCTNVTRVEKGDTISMEARYDLDLHPP